MVEERINTVIKDFICFIFIPTSFFFFSLINDISFNGVHHDVLASRLGNQ